MFHLIKILNGRTGVPEPARVSLTAPATVCYGMPVVIKSGVLSPMNSAATALPTHLILANGEAVSEVLATPITPEMLFEVPLSAAPTGMKAESEYLIADDGLSLTATAVTSGKRGATLVNGCGASTLGDNVVVSFKN